MKTKDWFENETFWIHYGPIMFDTQRWAEAPAVADYICAIAGLAKGSRIMDAGCGPGRISVELAAKGLEVTGIDIIQPFLDAAAESVASEGVRLKLLNADLRTFTAEQPFDAAVSLYTSFGYCTDQAEDILILRNIAASLKENGWFIMECLGREIAVRDFTEGEWFERAGKTVLTEFSVKGLWEGLQSRWILIDNKNGGRMEHTFVQRLYPASELKQILLSAGFRSAEVYGDFDFSPYNHKARTMVIIARK